MSVTGDTEDESDETVTVELSNAANATIGTGTGTGTITDDDDPVSEDPTSEDPVSTDPTLSIDSLTVTEGDGGATDLTFTVTLSAASDREVTVDYAEGTGRHGGGRLGLHGAGRFEPDLRGGGHPPGPSRCR